jgi:hypothetical protein
LSELRSCGPPWLLFSFPLDIPLELSFNDRFCLFYIVRIFCAIVSLILFLTEFSHYCISDPGYIFQVFQSRKQPINSKSVTTSTLQVFLKHLLTRLRLLLSQYRLFEGLLLRKSEAVYMEPISLSRVRRARHLLIGIKVILTDQPAYI